MDAESAGRVRASIDCAAEGMPRRIVDQHPQSGGGQFGPIGRSDAAFENASGGKTHRPLLAAPAFRLEIHAAQRKAIVAHAQTDTLFEIQSVQRESPLVVGRHICRPKRRLAVPIAASLDWLQANRSDLRHIDSYIRSGPAVI